MTAAVDENERMPEGWGAGTWHITGHSEVPGWLAIPAAVEDPHEWVAGRVDEIREAWGEHWDEQWRDAVPEVLQAGLDARPEGAALAFQIWPLPAPVIAQVSVFFGERPAALPAELAEGRRYVAEGLGAGVATVIGLDDPESGTTLLGLEMTFLSDRTMVVVRFEPTVAQLFSVLVGQFHAFVQTLVFVDPEGRTVRAVVPEGLPAAAVDDDWAGSVLPG